MTACRRVVEEALVHVDPYGLRPVHVSFDIDSCDPSVAPATGTPVKGAAAQCFPRNAVSHSVTRVWAGGLSYREAHFILECIAGDIPLSFPLHPPPHHSRLQPRAAWRGWTWLKSTPA